MWDILWLIAAFMLGSAVGRWFLIAQVKQLLIKIALDQGKTVEQLLNQAIQQKTPADTLRFRVERVNDEYYAWGPDGFAAQHRDPQELIKLLSMQYPDEVIALNPHELNLTEDKLTELLTNKHDSN
jgi:hypothetical protein